MTRRQKIVLLLAAHFVAVGCCSEKCPGVLPTSARYETATASRVKVERIPSSDACFELVEVRPALGYEGGALSECLLPEICLEDIPKSAVRFGSDGLKPIGIGLPSCGYLAVAEPRTRKGVVLGWISNVNGCGAFSVRRTNEGTVVVTPILDYGPMPVGTSVPVPDVFAIGHFDDCRLGLEAYADAAARYHGIRLPPNRSGYCTWCSDRYGYSDKSEFPNGAGAGTEASTLACAALAERTLKPYGFDFFQFDDQWQDGRENNGPARNFLRVNPKGPYPNDFGRVVAVLRGGDDQAWIIGGMAVGGFCPEVEEE